MAQREDRESIWSVHHEDLALYSHMFLVFWTLGVIAEWSLAPTPTLVPTIATSGLAAAILALVVLGMRDLALLICFWIEHYHERNL